LCADSVSSDFVERLLDALEMAIEQRDDYMLEALRELGALEQRDTSKCVMNEQLAEILEGR
jgi:hypothetical protein